MMTGRSSLAPLRHVPQRRFQLAFRVDHEVGSDDDLFPRREPGEHLDVPVGVLAELNGARLEVTIAGRDEDDLSGAGIEYRVVWDNELLAECGSDLGGG